MIRLLVILVVMLVPAVGTAQVSLKPGMRVRVTSPRHDLRKDILHVDEVRGDSIVLESNTFHQSVATKDITSLEVNVGVRTNFARDGLIGLVAGALVGAAVGAGTHDACSGDSPCIVPVSRATAITGGAAAFGAAGFVIGGLFGLFHITDDWERLPMPARASIGASRSGGVSLSFSKAF